MDLDLDLVNNMQNLLLQIETEFDNYQGDDFNHLDLLKCKDLVNEDFDDEVKIDKLSRFLNALKEANGSREYCQEHGILSTMEKEGLRYEF